MIWLAVVALGNMGVSIWLVRENRRYAQMAMSKHMGEYNSVVRAESKPIVKKKSDDADNRRAIWRDSAEGVAP